MKKTIYSCEHCPCRKLRDNSTVKCNWLRATVINNDSRQFPYECPFNDVEVLVLIKGEVGKG